jgi:hypothetical protein
MISDKYQSSLATGVPFGAGFISWGDYVEGFIPSETEVEETCQTVQLGGYKFAAWKDMTEEPWKYGDDIGDWMDLDAELSQAPGRWRLAAHWTDMERRANWERLKYMLIDAWTNYCNRKSRAATRIQALWRGHSVRSGLVWRDCCMCLAHTVSPIKTDVGFMCRMCSRDGPYVDLIGMDDPWEWYRAEK